ncbi:MAG: hypothetical protein CMJ83_20130 [Planctomycetes bacterium]|nr:hypothetical protein [Planctomycetota bacterium]
MALQPMETLIRRLRALADPMRLRILHLLGLEEVTVTELTRILNCGQSRVSGHLGRLAEEGLVVIRREGRFQYYSRSEDAALADPALAALLTQAAATEAAEVDGDALREAVAARPTGPPPGSLGRDYLPGRTWEGFARALLAMRGARRIADLGIGRGDITLLLAEGAEHLIAVDDDADTLAEARRRAEDAGLQDRISFRSGDVANPPIEVGEVDLWLLSQVLHLLGDPGSALSAAHARLPSGGRVIVLDLLAHQEAWVQSRLGHHQTGFTESALRALLSDAGFQDVNVRRAARDRKPPHFVTLLATGTRP